MQLAAEVLTALHETGTLQSSPAVAHAVELQLQELADVLASFSARWLASLALVALAWRSLCMYMQLIDLKQFHTPLPASSLLRQNHQA